MKQERSIYGGLSARWYRLLDPYEDHEEEASYYERALLEALEPERGEGSVGGEERPTLLELGAGAGNNALYLKRSFRPTLSDLSPAMLALSKALNPGCEHLVGDMRSLRLGRSFDAVMIHDAIAYMRTEADLYAAIETAFVHTRPGGAAIFAPDEVKERFEERSSLIETDAEGRSLRCIEWCWDPDPSDTEARTDFVFMMREGGEVRTVHESHLFGLFPEATWERLLREAGFLVHRAERRDEGEPIEAIFVGKRPR